MAQYEERLQNDLAQISDKLANLAQAVETALENATQALLAGSDEQAYAVMLGDLPINRASRELDRICHGFIAVHLPSAGHLRFVSAVMRVNLELERIGDYAVTICRETAQVGHPPAATVAQQMESMAAESRRILGQAVAAFNDNNTDLAEQTMGEAEGVRRRFEDIFNNLVNEGDNIGVKDLFAHIAVFNSLGRVADQAKNICEETVFAVSGQTKAAKVYRVLFLDEDNSTLSPMAQAIARKNFPNSGVYHSAGRQATAVNGELLEFLQERGLSLEDHAPQALDPAAELADYHVIVSLQGPVKSYLERIPFRTAALAWDVGAPPAGPDAAQNKTQFETLYRDLALQVRDLMITLRGEEAT